MTKASDEEFSLVIEGLNEIIMVFKKVKSIWRRSVFSREYRVHELKFHLNVPWNA